MERDGKHYKIGHNSAMSATISGISSNVNSSVGRTDDPWVFDIQWTAYPQIGGGAKLYLVCNPEFPYFWDTFETTVDYVRVQVAPASMGREISDPSTTSGLRWVWNSGVSFDINLELSQTKFVDGKPSAYTFAPNDSEVYMVYIQWGSNSTSNYAFTYNRFYMPEVYMKPTNLRYENGYIKFTANETSGVFTHAVEFYNAAPPPSPYNQYNDNIRRTFFEAACQTTEESVEGMYYNPEYPDSYKRFKIWSNTTHTIGVNFMGSVSSGLRNDFKGYVQQTVDIINSTITSGFKLRVVDGITNGVYSDIANYRGVGEIQLWWGTYQELWNEEAPTDWRYFGQWENDASNTNQEYITQGWVKLCTEKVWTMNYQGITWEEIVECIGLGNDLTSRYDTLWSDYWFPSKNLDGWQGTLSPYPNDLEVIKLAYNHNIPSNILPWQCANIVYAPNGYFAYFGYDENNISINVSGLNRNSTYYFRAVNVDYNDSSPFTSWIQVEIPDGVEKWEWTTMIRKNVEYILGGDSGKELALVDADEWNSFLDRVNEFRRYNGYSDYNFNSIRANSGDEFKSNYFNTVRDAILEVDSSAFITVIRPNITIVSPDLFDQLANAANALGGYT